MSTDKKVGGKSAVFKSVSRQELEDRPRYERDFKNDMYRYNVKYPDPKVKGKANFATSKVLPRLSKEKKHD